MARTARKQSKTGLIVTIIVLALTLGVVGGIVFAQNLNKTPAADTTQPSEQPNDTPAVQPEEETPATPTPEEQSIDPKTVSSIAIEPLKIKVFYKKGIPGFEFAVKRTAEGTQYVEFSAPDLKGTKCTDDEGIFASIIKNPTSDEDKATIKKERTIDDTTYGLSLNGKNCTSDVKLFTQYQDAFTYGLSLLEEDN